MNKKDLRAKFKNIRESIKNKKEKSYIITDKIINSECYKNSNIIALYGSMPFEVDTNLLIEKSLLLKKRVVLPKIVRENRMEFYEIFSLDDIEKSNTFGLKEPIIQGAAVLNSNIDLIIVPGICFDTAKNRVGFGKGYYDRFLTNSRNIKKIGSINIAIF